MNALVTGASGFIGSTLAMNLLSAGIRATPLVRPGCRLYSRELSPVTADFRDSAALRRAMRGIDTVFHIAGITKAVTPADFFTVNRDYTLRLAEAALSRTTPPRFVYISSLAAGGPSPLGRPRTEDDEDRPVSAYGRSKLEAERMLQAEAARMPIVIIRPPMVYGPKDTATLIFFKAVRRGFVPRLPSRDSCKTYSFIHVRDLCAGIAACGRGCGDTLRTGEVFYLSEGAPVRYEDFIAAIARALNSRYRLFPVPQALLMAAAAGATVFSRLTGTSLHFNWEKLLELEPDHWTCRADKAERLLDFHPQISLDLGLRDALDWYHRERWV